MAVKVRERPTGSGVWWVFIDHNGRRKAKKVGRDKKLALDAARKIAAKLTLGEFGLDRAEAKSVPTFGAYAETWIKTTIPATCKLSTLIDYRIILRRHVLPVFGKKPVTEINRLAVKKFLMDKSNSGFAPSTVTHMKNCLTGVFNLAVDDETIPANPAHKLGRVIRDKGLRLEIDPLNREELGLLLSTVQSHFPRYYPLFLTLARTGMRVGEALALQWGDIDFHGRFIMIRRGFSRGKIETPKNGKTRRVDMSRQLAQTLRELKHNMKVEAVRNGWGQIPEWVFVTEAGRCLHDTHFRSKVFNRALDKAGLRHIRIHDLRHSYASQLIQAGESLAYIRDQLGHHSIKVTVDIYGHLAPEGNKEAVDRLDDPAPAGKPVSDATIRNLSATGQKERAGYAG